MRDARARRDVPLDAANVVPRSVRPNLRELDSLALVARPVVAGEEAAQAAADRQLERTKRLRRERAGTRAFG
jgi:hypothetical protein